VNFLRPFPNPTVNIADSAPIDAEGKGRNHKVHDKSQERFNRVKVQKGELSMRFIIRITKQNESCYRAWCPALPGCAIVAESRQEAQKLIRQAAEGYMASLNAALPRELDKCFHMVQVSGAA
jgi:predicted RNase H-like HicB family nuclease